MKTGVYLLLIAAAMVVVVVSAVGLSMIQVNDNPVRVGRPQFVLHGQHEFPGEVHQLIHPQPRLPRLELALPRDARPPVEPEAADRRVGQLELSALQRLRPARGPFHVSAARPNHLVANQDTVGQQEA